MHIWSDRRYNRLLPTKRVTYVIPLFTAKCIRINTNTSPDKRPHSVNYNIRTGVGCYIVRGREKKIKAGLKTHAESRFESE